MPLYQVENDSFSSFSFSALFSSADPTSPHQGKSVLLYTFSGVTLYAVGCYATSPGVDCRPAMWQSVGREYTSNIRWNVRNDVR
eukprot:6731961-Pyramimonas_sp.AAC.1